MVVTIVVILSKCPDSMPRTQGVHMCGWGGGGWVGGRGGFVMQKTSLAQAALFAILSCFQT